MLEVGVCFLLTQFLLGIFIWKSSNRPRDEKIKSFPGGARALVTAAVIVVGAEVLALGTFGTKAWADIYLTPAAADAIQVQAQAGQFAYYFRYPGPDRKFGPFIPNRSTSRQRITLASIARTIPIPRTILSPLKWRYR